MRCLHKLAVSTGMRECRMVDSSIRSHPIGRKAEIRAQLLAARRVTPGQVTQVQTALVDALLQRECRTVAAYVPFGSEPGGPSLPVVLAATVGAAGRVLLPVVRADLDLDWAEHAVELVSGRRGTPEPAGPRLGLTAIGEAEVVVVPAVAVDRRGMRLGRGGGSYDRALARVAPNAYVVALLHDDELLAADLPAEAHDRRVDAAITPAHGLVPL